VQGEGGLKGGEGLRENRSRKLIFCVNTKYSFPALNGTADELERYSGGTPTVLLRYSRHCEGTAAVHRRYSDGTPVLRRNSGTPTELGGN